MWLKLYTAANFTVLSILGTMMLTPPTMAETPANVQDRFMTLDNAALLIGGKQQVYFSYKADTPMVPASTMKVLMAYEALETWGRDHHFTTDFYLTDKNTLCVKGSGDPFLTSSELLTAALNISFRELPELAGLTLDTSFFGQDITVDGRTQTLNPYDAPLSALAANFNTVSLKKTGQSVISAEEQTPLTELARSLSEKINRGSHRINVQSTENGEQQFAEIMMSFLQSSGVKIKNSIHHGSCGQNSQLVYQHENSHPLEEQVRGMLKYSNNFIANQLFLLLGAKQLASTPLSRLHFQQKVQENLGWKKGRIVDGAGLSRKNRFTANEMVSLLERFKPYADLLNCYGDVCAKTGTLSGVQTLAGYIKHRGELVPFALFVNEPVARNFRIELIQDWADAMNQLEPVLVAQNDSLSSE